MSRKGTDAHWPTRRRKDLRLKRQQLEDRAWDMGFALIFYRTEPWVWCYRIEEKRMGGALIRKGKGCSLPLCLSEAQTAIQELANKQR